MPVYEDLSRSEQEELDGLLKRHSQLVERRGNWDPVLQQCADFIHPHRGDFSFKRTPGGKRNIRLYDSCPVVINQHFAAGLQSRLIPPGEKWMALRVGGGGEADELNKLDVVRFWLEDTSDKMYFLFNSPKTNFNAAMHEAFLDMGAFGTPPIEIVNSSPRNIVFQSRHLGQFVFMENEHGQIDGCMREFNWTWRQIISKWPEVKGNLNHGLNNDAEKNPDKEMELLQIIVPNKEIMRNAFSDTGKPFKTLIILMKDKTILDVGGFEEFPYVVPRY
ncbi:MAG TPA: hypothetical protein EYQ21_05505, partial [Flavobacteriales bacterium]|nr:hypothetical protein [Flavobacteriales bacterium]